MIMKQERSAAAERIPAIIWGEPSDKVYIYVHGKMSRKEYAGSFAEIAEEKGFQTLSFDLPEHGERAGEPDRCDIWNGIRDLGIIADLAFGRWKSVSLYACSLGAYFSLNAYADRPFEKCLFQSPIVDMKWLVENMMLWAKVTPEQLRLSKEIDTPLDTLRWDYYQYILAHPVAFWPLPTAILYAGQDELQPEASIRRFAERFGCELTVSEKSKHPFMEPDDFPVVEKWLREHT